jgi:hypothetical protein
MMPFLQGAMPPSQGRGTLNGQTGVEGPAVGAFKCMKLRKAVGGRRVGRTEGTLVTHYWGHVRLPIQWRIDCQGPAA